MANLEISRLFLTSNQIEKPRKGTPVGLKFSKTQLKNKIKKLERVVFYPLQLATLEARTLPFIVKGALAGGAPSGAAKDVEKVAGKGVRIDGTLKIEEVLG